VKKLLRVELLTFGEKNCCQQSTTQSIIQIWIVLFAYHRVSDGMIYDRWWFICEILLLFNVQKTVVSEERKEDGAVVYVAFSRWLSVSFSSYMAIIYLQAPGSSRP
jgi:hypothetical protein